MKEADVLSQQIRVSEPLQTHLTFEGSGCCHVPFSCVDLEPVIVFEVQVALVAVVEAGVVVVANVCQEFGN